MYDILLKTFRLITIIMGVSFRHFIRESDYFPMGTVRIYNLLVDNKLYALSSLSIEMLGFSKTFIDGVEISHPFGFSILLSC